MQECIIECPHCGEEAVKALHRESYLQARTSRISAGAKVTMHREPDKYIILSGCENCGRDRKEIETALNNGTNKMNRENFLKRLKESGLPTVIETKM